MCTYAVLHLAKGISCLAVLGGELEDARILSVGAFRSKAFVEALVCNLACCLHMAFAMQLARRLCTSPPHANNAMLFCANNNDPSGTWN